MTFIKYFLLFTLFPCTSQNSNTRIKIAVSAEIDEKSQEIELFGILSENRANFEEILAKKCVTIYEDSVEAPCPDSCSWLAAVHCGESAKFSETSVIDQIQKAFLWGASAVIMLAVNGDYFGKMNFNKNPVILVVSTNITKILKVLTSSTQIAISKATSTFDSFAKLEKVATSTLTTWGVCGRLSTMGFFPWEGTVCVDQSDESKTNPDTFWTFYYFILMLFCLLLLIKSRYRSSDVQEVYFDSQLAAKKALKHTRCYKCSIRHFRPKNNSSDPCAICLDEYADKQIVRVLPCKHKFHAFCVDAWLTENFTCPLCKLNIVDWLLDQSSTSDRSL